MKKLQFIILISILLLSGCASNQNMYLWGKRYQPGLYSYLQGEFKDLEKDIANMDETMHKAASENKKLPPGFYAQLGLLHGKLGDHSKMRDYFVKEKQLFPESKEYMNFLLSKHKLNNHHQKKENIS